MSQAGLLQASAHVHEAPSIVGALIFRLKALVFQSTRVLRNIRGAKRHARGQALIDFEMLAECSTPLSTTCDEREAALIAGKIQNLRIAIRAIDGLEVPANQVFSFWRQIGRPTRRRGYAMGRELRQGCLIPTVGGGLCQLSNALYQCALESGFEIIERHAHSQVVPGSAAEYGMDATVFWNYVDLRFRSRAAFRIEASLSGHRLVVRFKGNASGRRVRRSLPPLRPASKGAPSNCSSCGVRSCFRNEEGAANHSIQGRTAYLVDEYWPEFEEFIESDRKAGDAIGIPLDGKLLRRARYRWNTTGFEMVRKATIATLKRSLEMRYVPPQGASRQRILIRHDRKLAESLARLLTFDVDHVVVMQNLLPYLWSEGHLSARSFDVLMTRLPMETLQARLDAASNRHPESTTLGDFRADAWMVEAERQALATARRIITPNTDVASLFGARAVLTDWHIPKVAAVDRPARGTGILFPASTLGRKGAYEVRDVARILGLELTILGHELEGPGFWGGIPTRHAEKNLLDGIGLVVLPAYIEDKPRLLLRAAACGIPVIASAACGLERVPGVVTLPAVDARILAVEISSLFSAGPNRQRDQIETPHASFCDSEASRQSAVSVAGGDCLRTT